MPIPTVTITGKVLTPNGQGAAGGMITIRPSAPGVVRDTTGDIDQKIGGEQRIAIGVDGSVSFTLVPNASIAPAGTTYHVQYVLQDGASWTEDWSLAAAPGAQEIGDVTVVSSTPLVEGVQLPAGTHPGATPPGSMRRRFVYVEGTAGFPDELFIVMKNGNETMGVQFITGGNPA